MRMLKGNFESALLLAIDAIQKRDKQAANKESAFIAGLKEVLDASIRGERIEIKKE